MNIDKGKANKKVAHINKLPNEILLRISDMVNWREDLEKRISARMDAEEYIKKYVDKGLIFPNHEKYIESVINTTMSIPVYSMNENMNPNSVREELDRKGIEFINNVRGK